MSSNPYLTVWTRPRATVCQVIQEGRYWHVVVLSALAGMVKVLDRASSRNLGDSGMSLNVILGIVVVFGPLLGILGLWTYAWAIKLSGRLLGGAGNYRHLCTALGWACVPTVAALLLWLPLLHWLGPQAFTEETPVLDERPELVWPVLVIGAVDLLLGFWSYVLMCKMVAEVQGFHSAWRGLFNTFLAVLLVALGLGVVALVVVLIIRLF